jgi:hypothetical protein
MIEEWEVPRITGSLAASWTTLFPYKQRANHEFSLFKQRNIVIDEKS